jgi:hypothetical protein
MALGGGYMSDASKLEGAVYQGQVTAAGGALGLELAIGGALTPGFVLGGSFSLHTVGDAKLRNDSRTNAVSREPVRTSHDPELTMLALLIDDYPNPKGGFHFGGAVGFAALSVRGDNNPETRAQGAGLGIAPHVGYEWWISNYWGLGVLGKFTFAHTEGDYSAGNGGVKDNIAAAAILFSATYN